MAMIRVSHISIRISIPTHISIIITIIIIMIIIIIIIFCHVGLPRPAAPLVAEVVELIHHGVAQLRLGTLLHVT